jgi:lycopene cyclase CruA
VSTEASPERARALVREAGGEELVERLEHLDRHASTSRDAAPLRAPKAGDPRDADVVFAGGGLSLLLAPLVARSGLRVCVVDRARIGEAHREWNASGEELEALVACGLVSRAELEELVVARYERGICRWHEGGTWPVRGALDHAVDAGALLRLARRASEEAGVMLLDHHTVEASESGPGGVRVALRDRSGTRRELTAALFVEARGASRPDQQADLLCPTVGGVIEGLEQGSGEGQIDPTVGEILVTTEHVEEERQHIWEAFPGRAGQTTVYLFYYAPRELVRPGALLSLYARFFERLGRYKRGSAKLVRPTFGLIPGWTRMSAPPRPRTPRVALVGDAASRHSPLTFCGFGAMLRSLEPASRGITQAAISDAAGFVPSLVHDTPLHGGTGALAMMMARPDVRRPAALNRLLDTAFGTLHRMGDAPYRALIRDEMSATDFASFLLRVSARSPSVYRDVFGTFGVASTLSWASRVGASVFDGVRGPRPRA